MDKLVVEAVEDAVTLEVVRTLNWVAEESSLVSIRPSCRGSEQSSGRGSGQGSALIIRAMQLC